MRVSVCIPTVDRIAYFAEALASVLAQTFDQHEIIVSDNSGSPAYTAELERVVEAALRNARGIPVRTIIQPERVDAGEHANLLAEVSESDYWAYLPDDDRMCPAFLSTMVALLDQYPNAGFAFSDHWIVDADGRIDGAETERMSRSYHRSGLDRGFIPHGELLPLALAGAFPLHSTLFRTPVIRAFRFDVGNYALDYDLLVRIAASTEGFGACYSPERLIEYRVHGGQSRYAGFTSESVARSVITSLERCSNVPASARRAYRVAKARAHAALAGILLKDGHRSQARRCLLASVRAKPTSTVAYRQLALMSLPQGVTNVLRRVARRLVAGRRPAGSRRY